MNRRLFFLLIPILIATCSMQQQAGNPCAGSVPPVSSNRPVVCVDDTNLANITSAPFEAHGKRQSPIKWYTVSGQGGLSIAFQNQACVMPSTVNCSAGSSCNAQINSNAVYGAQCKYTVTITRKGTPNTEDPVVIIDDGVYDPGA